jgi:hypothetical protein
MKKFQMALIVKCLLLISINSQAQNGDVITKKDGTTIKGKVIQVTEAAIEIDPEGDIPFQIIKRSDVALIKYSNGTEVKLGVIETQSKPQSFTAEKRSNDLFDRLFSKGSSRKLNAIALEVSEKTDYSKPTTVEVKYSFNDTGSQLHDLKLVYQQQKGFYKRKKAEFYVDGTLAETRGGGEGEDKYATSWQWINSTIPGERILVTANFIPTDMTSNGSIMEYVLLGAVDRLDGPANDSEEMKKLRQLRENMDTRPQVLLDETINVREIIGAMQFYKSETYYLGKDKKMHWLKIETDYSNPVLNCRLYIDQKMVKEGTADAKKAKIIGLTFEAEVGDHIEVNINQSGGYNSEQRVILVKIL